MPHRVLIIANPVSGGGRARQRARALARALQDAGAEVTLQFTEPGRTGRAVAAELAPGSCDCIAVVGGDGSLRDVLDGLDDFDTPIAQLPAGTANVWAKEAGIPRSPRRVAAMIIEGATVDAALGFAFGRRFFLFVGAGIDARIVRRVEAQRRQAGGQGGMLRWIAPGWKEFWRRRLPDLRVTVEGETHSGMAEVLVTRVRHYAGLMKLPTDIDVGDGMLHVLAWPRARSKAAFVGQALRAAAGRLRPGVDLLHVATRGPVRIEAADDDDDEPCHLDGDAAPPLPVEVALTGETARLIVPRQRAAT